MGDAPFLLLADGTVALSYAERAAAADRLAASLARQGVREGDVVAPILPAGPEFAVAMLACWRLGAVLAPISPQLAAAERERAMAVTRPRALLTPEVELLPEGGPGPEPAAGPGDGLLLLTSGSTGTPKAVVLTRANLECGTGAVRDTFGLCERDSTLALLPWTHGHGLIGVLAATAAGGGSVRLAGGGGAPEALAAIAAGGVTWISVVPPLLALLTEAAARQDVRGRLRFVRTASAPLPVALARRAEAAFGCPVAEAYGMTETTHQAAANPPDGERRRLGTVGLPTASEIRLGAGEVAGGSPIEVRGPGLFRGYLGRPDLTAAALTPDGWYRTLDVGTIEDGGYVRLLGRQSEFINRGGYKVAPAEVEEAVSEHAAVAACLVAPVPHPVLGEEVGVLVVLNADARLSLADLRRHCGERLAEYKRPGVVRFVDRLPSLPNGKPSRRLAAGVLAAPR